MCLTVAVGDDPSAFAVLDRAMDSVCLVAAGDNIAALHAAEEHLLIESKLALLAGAEALEDCQRYIGELLVIDND